MSALRAVIHPYSGKWREQFRSLNEEWLKKFFTLEPKDVELLSDPEGTIIRPGGMIFFAERGGAIIGTVALIPHGEDAFEVGKMAVTEAAQGSGAGKALMERCLAAAAERGAKKLLLYSNTSLGAAIHLYRKYGFVEVPLTESGYLRSNIKMELVFK